MPQFTDATGQEWEFRRITFGDMDELAGLGLDVEAVSADLAKLADVIENRRRFAAVLWWFVGDAVEGAGLSAADFYRRLDGNAMYEAAVAVRDAVIDFFPYPPAVKAKLIADLTAGQTAAAGSVVARSSSQPSPGSTPTA